MDAGSDTAPQTCRPAETNIKRLLETDVLVVGGSLAGLAAAETAAHGGVRTVLVDAASEVGARPNPANVIMEPLWPKEYPIPTSAVVRELTGVRVSGPSGVGPLFRFRSFIVDRREFDRFYVRRAQAAGAEVRGGVRVEGPLSSGGVRTDKGDCLARVTIFADGATSPVRKIFETMADPGSVAWGLDQLLEAPGIGEAQVFEVRFGSFAPGWRAQLNPIGGDRAHLWSFARGRRREEMHRFALHARQRILGRRTVEVIDEVSGADPAFVRSGQLVGRGVMACGAAAAQGGVEAGARAGMLAGRVAAGAVRKGDTSRAALVAYEEEWLRRIKAQQFVFTWIIGSVTQLSDRKLDRVFEPLAEADLDEQAFVGLLRGEPQAVYQLLRSVGYGNACRSLGAVGLGLVISSMRRMVSGPKGHAGATPTEGKKVCDDGRKSP